MLGGLLSPKHSDYPKSVTQAFRIVRPSLALLSARRVTPSAKLDAAGAQQGSSNRSDEELAA
jgi:hypothetical protein